MKLKADPEFAKTIRQGGPNQFGIFMAVLYADAYRVINLETGEFPRGESFKTHQEAQDAAIVAYSEIALKETAESLGDGPVAVAAPVTPKRTAKKTTNTTDKEQA